MYNKEKPETIRAMFNSIAQGYDRANAILSLSLHKRWNRLLWNRVMEKKGAPSFLDLCCGTGESSLPFLSEIKDPMQAYLLDFSEQMLGCAKEKSSLPPLHPHSLHFLHADALQIPLADASMPRTLMAYAIRNVQDPLKCLREIYRILTPSGRCGILELTRPKNPLLRIGHSLYLRTLLPTLGRLVTSNREAYAYLSGSIRHFVDPSVLVSLAAAAGFQHITVQPLSGGIATLFLLEKNP